MLGKLQKEHKIKSLLLGLIVLLFCFECLNPFALSDSIQKSTVKSKSVMEINEIHKEMSDLIKKLEEKEKTISHLKNDLQQTKLQQEESLRYRQEIIQKINSIDLSQFQFFKVDKKNGKITILQDEAYTYVSKKGYVLSEEFKKEFKAFLPMYSKIIFGDEKWIDKIEISGFSSPTYKKRYISPDDYHAKAYLLNLKVSYQRASQLGAFIAGDSSGEFTNKSLLKQKIDVTGYSFLKPIPLQNPDKKLKNTKNCGPYDCKASKRIEISFKVLD